MHLVLQKEEHENAETAVVVASEGEVNSRADDGLHVRGVVEMRVRAEKETIKLIAKDRLNRLNYLDELCEFEVKVIFHVPFTETHLAQCEHSAYNKYHQFILRCPTLVD